MEVNICRMCKRSFIARKKKYCCNDCKEAYELLFERVKEYLALYPNSSAMQVSMWLDAPIEVILAFIDEGRLTFSKGTFERLQ